MQALLEILSWLTGEIGTALERHKQRALQFIKEASERAALRRKK